MVEGSLGRTLFRLAAPAVLSTGLVAGFGIVDTLFVGRGLDAAALAALATASFVLWGLEALALAVSVGLTAVVSRRVGEEDNEGLQRVVRQGLSLAAVAGVLVAGVGWFLAPVPFVLMDVAPDVAAQGTSYLRVLFAGALAIFVFHAVAAVLRGTGDMRTPLALLAGALLVNVGLDAVLIFGWGGFPRMEVAGAAVATVLSHGGAAVMALTC